MKVLPKKRSTPASLRRSWLLFGFFLVVLYGGGAAYLHDGLTPRGDASTYAIARVREYREKRLPELEAVADRQELVDELGRMTAKTERFLRETHAGEESLLGILANLPRLMALTAAMLFFVILLGYGYLRAMKALCEQSHDDTTG